LRRRLGHIHRIADRRLAVIGISGLIAAIATAADCGDGGAQDDAHPTGDPLMRTLIEILAGLAILANAIICGTDVFGAIRHGSTSPTASTIAPSPNW
jgi:hypothetical protein